jgi:hypothetical protein
MPSLGLCQEEDLPYEIYLLNQVLLRQQIADQLVQLLVKEIYKGSVQFLQCALLPQRL